MGDSGFGLLAGLVLVTVVLPAVVGSVAVFAARGLPGGERWGVPIAWAGGYLAAHGAIVGAPVWPPVTTAQGVVLVVVAATAASLLLGSLSARPGADIGAVPALASRLVPLASLVCLVSILWVSLRSMIRYQWQGLEAGLWVTAIALLIGTLLAAGNVLRTTTSALAQVLAWGLGFSGLALALAMSSTALMAQLSAVCAVLAATVWATGAGKDRSAFVSLPPILVSSLSVFVLSGAFYADLPVWSGALLLVAPTAGLLASTRVAGGRKRALVAALTVVLIQSPALGAAALRFLESGRNEYNGYDYSDLAPGAGAIGQRARATHGSCLQEQRRSPPLAAAPAAPLPAPTSAPAWPPGVDPG